MERLSVIYASALFDLAIKHNAVDEFYNQAIYLRDSLCDDDCRRMLCHPQIPADVKHDFFRTAFAEHIHKDLLGFLFLVADKNREKYLLAALDKLIDIIKQHKRIVTAKVLSAAPYDENQSETLRAMLSQKLRKQVTLDLKVDSTLIGGPYIYVDGYYIDWTVKKKLHDLTIHMKEGCSA